MNFSIVVARYNEDLEWTKQFLNVIIYNKGTPLTDDFTTILLNNVGRESHTYYKHIYDNYDNLTDYIIFLQGNPFDHSPNVLSNINKYINNKDLSIDFEFLSEKIFTCNLNGLEFFSEASSNCIVYPYDGCTYNNGLPLIENYEKIFGERKENMEFKFGCGAQFIVSKKKILQRPKEFYLKNVELLDNDINPIEGYVFERFHSLIFN